MERERTVQIPHSVVLLSAPLLPPTTQTQALLPFSVLLGRRKTVALLLVLLSLDRQEVREKERERMLLGKRNRPSMRRTTSMTEFELSLEFPPSALEAVVATATGGQQQQQKQQQRLVAGGGYYPSAVVPQGPPRRSLADFLTMEGAAHFLRSCTLCKRRIGPGRDIYMYKGDTAYCSLECRQQQMNMDERKEKCSLTSMRKKPPNSGSGPSGNGEAAVAA